MLGAIIGDIVGSPYEFDDTAIKTTDFEFFSDQSSWTDDTVMTVAVAEALLRRPACDDEAKAALVESMRRWGRGTPLPAGGYGARFYRWLHGDDQTPYGSYGNGSAMRVSAAGWLYPTLEETEHWAELTAAVTHNHPEGIKGARATAAAIFLARTGHNKAEIGLYVAARFGYDLSRPLDQIRPTYHHLESCQETVPEAITAFLESNSFENAIRLAVSLGGDSDTLAAIAGSVAEAFYGIPPELQVQAKARLSPPLLAVLTDFETAVREPENSRSRPEPASSENG
ncbi:MAG: ADP-ribosylglycohydrolase family protein [Propionibacteriaceae bacterium]|jgi:ADP-ribosylglycohydrolase|nr:ADP-ribosylglycohydrolase family protein [Propionibacteriaceae bacterium]